MGPARITMLRHGVPDIRLLYEGDMRFLSQFTAGHSVAGRRAVNVSRRWLERFLRRSLDAQDISARLAAQGAAVDVIEPLNAGLGEIRVALVEEVRQHPNADRLRVCTVNDGSAERRQVVCGAPNVTAGRKYPFAPVGATVPVGKGGGPMRIEKAKLRGELSEGMLCSARELGVGVDADGLWELDTDAAPGTLLLEALPLDDDRIVVDVTPNRPDLLGHKGIARELAASLNVPYRLPQLGPGPLAPDVPPVQRAASVRETVTGPLRVAIDDPEGCARFHAAVVRGVKVGPIAGVAAAAARGGRGPLHQQHRGRHELRDARAGTADARVRPRHAQGTGPRGSAGTGGREAGDAGRRRSARWMARPR